MTNRLAHRALLAAVLIAGSQNALAQSPTPNVLGTWVGDYVCPQGKTGLTLTIDRQGGSAFSGYFHFYPIPENERPLEGCYNVSGRITPDGELVINGGSWITQPPNYITVDLAGRHVPNEQSLTGNVVSQLPAETSPGCGAFHVVKQRDTVAPGPPCQSKSISLVPRTPWRLVTSAR